MMVRRKRDPQEEERAMVLWDVFKDVVVLIDDDASVTLRVL